MKEQKSICQLVTKDRTKGSTGISSKFGNEIDWTPIVADEATRILREAGVYVMRTTENIVL